MVFFSFCSLLIGCPFIPCCSFHPQGCLSFLYWDFHGLNHSIIFCSFFHSFIHSFCPRIHYPLPKALVAMLNFIHISVHFLISLPTKWTSLIYCIIFSLIDYFIPHLVGYISSLIVLYLILPIPHSFHITSSHFLIPAINFHVLFAVFSFYPFLSHNLEPRFLLRLGFVFYCPFF